MDDRFNTIAGWVLFAGIVALGSSIVSSELFHTERPEKPGYPIAGAEEETGGAAAEQPIETYLATSDPAKGQQVFNKCMACHNADKGGANQLGPNLWDVIGQPIGQGKGGFAFSDALSKKGGTWNWDNLSQWLSSPRSFAPGTKMTFAGLSNPQDRANVEAFLNSHSDSPQPLPKAPAAAPAAAGAAAGKEPVLNTAVAEGNPKNSGGPAAKTSGPKSVKGQP